MDSKQCEQTEIQKLDLKIERWIDKCIKCKVDRKSIQQSLNNQLIERLDQAQNWITIKSLFKQFMIYLIICCLVVGLLCHCEFISDVTKSIGRILLIKLWPDCKWLKFHQTGCLIFNPHFKSSKSLARFIDCDLCEDYQQLIRLTNQSFHAQLVTHLIDNRRPFLIDCSIENQSYDVNQLQQWNLNRLQEFYQNNSNEHDTCEFETNVAARDHLHYLEQLPIAIHFNQSTYALWENCGHKLMRKLRQDLVPIASVFPPMLEFSQTSWTILSTSHHRMMRFKMIRPSADTKLQMITQIHGQSEWRIAAHSQCNCQSFNIKLHPFDQVIVYPDLWDVKYRSNNESSFSLVYISGATF